MTGECSQRTQLRLEINPLSPEWPLSPALVSGCLVSELFTDMSCLCPAVNILQDQVCIHPVCAQHSRRSNIIG